MSPPTILGPLLTDADRVYLRERALDVRNVYLVVRKKADSISIEEAASIFALCAAESTIVRNLLELDQLTRSRP